jgi:hypothetical protein
MQVSIFSLQHQPLAAPEGVEPPTVSLGRTRSIQLSYGAMARC